MLYLIHGTDWEKSRAKTHELIDALRKKKPDAELFRLDGENWSEAKLEELAGGIGLFERKFIVFADRLLGGKESSETVLAKMPEIASSENVFILLEDELKGETLKKAEKYAEKTQIFSVARKFAADRFNIFNLADAFGRRDKQTLWVLYQKALRAGAAAEEIHGTLFWQIKSMIVASGSRTAAEAGLNPFVYKKAQGFLRHYKQDELKKFSSQMVSIYHDARRGGSELETALERLVLTI